MKRVARVVAPNGAAGGGMGRVKDYIVESPAEWWGDLQPQPLVTRDVGGKLESLRLLLGACRTIWRGKRDGSLALVHVNMGDRGSAARKSLVVMTCWWLKVPVFLHLHAVQLHKLKPRTLRLVAIPFRCATAIIVLGEVYRRYVREELGVTKTPIEILTNGVPIVPVAGRVHEQPVDRPFTLLFLGRLGEQKGLSDLIAALALLPQDPPGWRMLIIGSGDIEGYRAKTVEAGVADHVEFRDWLDQKASREIMLQSDILVLPSYDEGLPLVILEALGLGTPVIATPVGAIPEVLTEGKEVVFCRVGDRQNIADTIARVMADRDLRQSLCDNGLKTFDRLFSVEAFCKSLYEIWMRYLPAKKI